MKRLHFILLIISLFFYNCDPKKKGNNEADQRATKTAEYFYNLSQPNQMYVLPKKLTEISGLSYLTNNKLAAINDETGKLYIYDLANKEIDKTIDFGKNDDYEGVEVVGNIAYVLVSSGKIKAINLEDESVENIDGRNSDVAEFEGITYDKTNNSLLLAAKIMKGKLKVFEYSLTEKSLEIKFEIAENDIDKNELGREFRPSGIAIDTQKNEIYLLASAGKKLIVFSQIGQKIKQYNLDNEIFKQPEGICFGPNGQLFVASEGKGGNGYILQFNLSSTIQ